ncbi:metallophosphoesterase family protein [Rubellicoccus peritrichatus]|uniref:Metallophosphoesterase family protein n=1 Tax=Rubellicoccus peritrichatus TaxID=3080537 RepID=A0AAQ3LAX2_9BACT|nr:metallophosphoesterase family protein [Puniceicoccus sp. CR14]WOO41199.1 metallophosphoesterase family protein [Puniceicoccus sp. CR14]
MKSRFYRVPFLQVVVLTAVFATSILDSRADLLKAGPMAGYSKMRETAIWLQTNEPSQVKIQYWPKDSPSKKSETSTKQTTIDEANTATLIAGNLDPGTLYEYRVFVDGKPVAADYALEFQTPPFYRDRFPPPDFKVALGGGHYANDKAYDPLNRIPGGDYSIFLAIAAKNPDMMIWLGNNIFLREPDWDSDSGVLSRYSKNREQPELQPLLGSVHHLATWSTHDFGAEGADRLSQSGQHARHAFDLFWANPPHDVAGINGITAKASWSDVDFFILDDRTNRDLTSRVSSKRQILGEEQIKWLVESLRRSNATFKVVVNGSPILNPADSPENLQIAEDERDELLEALKDADIPGLFFVAGGKSHGELTKLVRANAPDVYELTLGPLTGRPASDTRELNYFRVPGNSVFQRHFSILEFHGPEDDRQMRVSVYDVNGTEIWTDNFHASSMQF